MFSRASSTFSKSRVWIRFSRFCPTWIRLWPRSRSIVSASHFRSKICCKFGAADRSVRPRKRTSPRGRNRSSYLAATRKFALRMIKKRPPHVVVDLSGVTFIDSSGLAVLIRAMQDVQKYGGKLRLSGMNENVRPIFEIARLDQIFVIDRQSDELLAD